MEVYIPTTKELADNINEKVIDGFAELVFVAESGSYEMRSCFRLLDKFDKLNKASYGSLKHFANYCSNDARYNRFIDAYEYFLI